MEDANSVLNRKVNDGMLQCNTHAIRCKDEVLRPLHIEGGPEIRSNTSTGGQGQEVSNYLRNQSGRELVTGTVKVGLKSTMKVVRCHPSGVTPRRMEVSRHAQRATSITGTNIYAAPTSASSASTGVHLSAHHEGGEVPPHACEPELLQAEVGRVQGLVPGHLRCLGQISGLNHLIEMEEVGGEEEGKGEGGIVVQYVSTKHDIGSSTETVQGGREGGRTGGRGGT